ncbi:MAG: SoxR reducing system RseC family protein [Candidatus Eisenbacteria bacterium]|nr:SoxR reducing system RseC family protein [Candidatus Eisenbacteria bacterium]
MTEVGRVVSVNDDAAVVAMGKSGSCNKCGLCMASSDGREVLLLARNAAGAGPGDSVEIEISAGRVLVAAFALYMLPVLMTILGFVVGSAISGGSEESALPIVLAVVFLVVSFVAVWLFDVKVRKTERRHATVIRVLTEAEAEASPRIEIVKFGG